MRCKNCGAKVKDDFCPYCLSDNVKYEEPMDSGKSVLCLFFGHICAIITMFFAMVAEAGTAESIILIIIGLVGAVGMGIITVLLFVKSGISERVCKTEGWVILILGIIIAASSYFIGSVGITFLGMFMFVLGIGLIQVGNFLI